MGSFVAEHNSWISSSMSSSSSSAEIRAYKSSSSSSLSIVTAIPFSTMDSYLCRGFLSDIRTGPIACLSFLGLGVRGDLGIYVTTLAPYGTSSIILVCVASLVVTSSIPKPSLEFNIVASLYSITCELRGSIIARLLILSALLKSSILK